MINSLFKTIKQGCVQLFKNKNLLLTSLFSITAMFLVLSIFFALIVNVTVIAEASKSQFNTISVYLKEEAPQEQIDEITEKAQNLSTVSSVSYISKEAAKANFAKRYGENSYIFDSLNKNPFPASLEIKVIDIKDAKSVSETVKGMPGIDEVKFNGDVINKMIKITKTIQLVSLVVVGILIVISIIIIANIVKLTVLARGREISIIKYIGATNWFIRGPFLVEGIVIGIVSSLISLGFIAILYGKVVKLFSEKMFVWFSVGFVPESFLIQNLAIILFALGICIGALGSVLSMRRFLET